MRKVLFLAVLVMGLTVTGPFLVFGAPPAQAASCTIDPQAGPVTGQVGTELTFFINLTGCASSNKLPSFKVVDGRLPSGTKLFDFAGGTGLINGVPTTAGIFTFTVQVKDETRATDTETFTIEILPAEAPTITTVALSSVIPGRWLRGRFLPASSCRRGRTPSPVRPPRLGRSPLPSASPTIWTPSARKSSPSLFPERQALCGDRDGIVVRA
jgi:hypothetical protein